MPKFTFGIIVLNGLPFIKYNLEALYPHAHQIIVVEGAAPGAKNIARSDGHSRDGTLEFLREYKASHDPENKVTIVTAEDEGHPDGVWPGEKDEMSQAYARRATGDYLWQVDADEFYLDEDIKKIGQMLNNEKWDAVTFPQLTFWGDEHTLVDSLYLRAGARFYHRLFKWKPGYSYQTHRPPTVLDETGADLRSKKHLTGPMLEGHGIYLYHYSLLLPKQVQEKCDYYANAQWAKRHKAVDWAETCYDKLHNPFRVHNVYDYLSWLDEYKGARPKVIQKMMQDLSKSGDYKLRKMDDVTTLLSRPSYRIKKTGLKIFAPVYAAMAKAWPVMGRLKRRILL